MRAFSFALVLAIACGSPASCFAVTLWNEAVDGPLSGDRLAPSSFQLLGGDNHILGTVQGGASSKRDYVTLTVAPGTQLTQIVLVSYDSTDQQGFIGIQHGTTFTESPAAPNVANILGYTHFGRGPGNIGLNILPSMGTGPSSQGFIPPLPVGSYTFWIQQLGATTNFDFDFIAEKVPEPSTAALAALAMCGLLLCWRRRALSC